MRGLMGLEGFGIALGEGFFFFKTFFFLVFFFKKKKKFLIKIFVLLIDK